MASSGQQIAEANFQKFTSWLSSKTDNQFRQMVNREGVLSRKEIVAQCGFGGSAINQNPRIKASLLEKEIELRARGILPLLGGKKQPEGSGAAGAPASPMPSAVKSFDSDRLHRLELENASLKVENQELKRQLEKFAVLRELLSTTGRLPR